MASVPKKCTRRMMQYMKYCPTSQASKSTRVDKQLRLCMVCHCRRRILILKFPCLKSRKFTAHLSAQPLVSVLLWIDHSHAFVGFNTWLGAAHFHMPSRGSRSLDSRGEGTVVVSGKNSCFLSLSSIFDEPYLRYYLSQHRMHSSAI